MSAFIHLIADYGESDPAFSEVVHRLTHADPSVRVQTTAVPPLSTVATGFWIEQLGLHNPPFEDLLVYSNTAPRTDAATPTGAESGGSLCYVELVNGVPIVAVDAGYNLSFVRDHIDTFRTVDIDVDSGSERSQFRSRDFFPTPVSEIVNGVTRSLGERRSVAEIPAKPEATVCHVDGYGNVKTSIRTSEFAPDDHGDDVMVTIDGHSARVSPRDDVTTVREGTMGIIPGSAGGDDPYMELFLRGGSAATAFESPEPGDTIRFE